MKQRETNVAYGKAGVCGGVGVGCGFNDIPENDCGGSYVRTLIDFKSAFFSRPREKWHMMEKMPILIFRPEIPYDESINVVYVLGSQLSVFSRKFSKTASSAHRRKMPKINAASTDTNTLLLDIAEGSRIF